MGSPIGSMPVTVTGGDDEIRASALPTVADREWTPAPGLSVNDGGHHRLRTGVHGYGCGLRFGVTGGSWVRVAARGAVRRAGDLAGVPYSPRSSRQITEPVLRDTMCAVAAGLRRRAAEALCVPVGVFPLRDAPVAAATTRRATTSGRTVAVGARRGSQASVQAPRRGSTGGDRRVRRAARRGCGRRGSRRRLQVNTREYACRAWLRQPRGTQKPKTPARRAGASAARRSPSPTRER